MPPERVDLEALAPSPAAGFATVTTFAFDEQPHTAMPQKMPSRSRRQHQGRSTAPPFAACEQIATSPGGIGVGVRSDEPKSELQSLMRISYAVFCLKKQTT